MMSSATMAVQDQNLPTESNTHLCSNNEVSSKEQFPCGIYFSPKVRKPYTISKQRERWTDEEHKKFLEALRLYGRAWRRIEEHVGTKTAVQIRSHAQKFFSKVIRDSSANDSNMMEPIEIPPPRPKRKPIHPYPRKRVQPLAKEARVVKHPVTSPLSNLFTFDLENQSPKSILSAVRSNALGSPDSSSTNHSSSPVSSQVDDAITPISTSDKEFIEVQRNNLFPAENDSSNGDGVEERPSQILKLFGKTVVVGECRKPPSPIDETSTLPSSDRMTMDTENGQTGVFCYVQCQKNDNSDMMGAGYCGPPQWWTFCGGTTFPVWSFYEQTCGKGIQKEDSLTGSNSGPGTEEGNGNTDAECGTQSQPNARKEKESTYEDVEDKAGLKLDSSKPRTSTKQSLYGFVPYKRNVGAGDGYSSTITQTNCVL